MKKKQPPVTTLDADGQPRRKLSEEHEDMTVHLTENQISDERARVCSLMQEVEKLDAEVKSATAGTRARIKELKAKIAASVAAAQSGSRVESVLVETFMKYDGEIVRVRVDTNDVLSTRRASDVERQEILEFGGAL